MVSRTRPRGTDRAEERGRSAGQGEAGPGRGKKKGRGATEEREKEQKKEGGKTESLTFVIQTTFPRVA